MKLQPIGYLGTQICPIDGTGKEVACCITTKALAIKRHNEDKPYTMAECRLCGSGERENFIPVREFYTSIYNKEDANKTLHCKACGILIPNKKTSQKWCKACAPIQDKKYREEYRNKKGPKPKQWKTNCDTCKCVIIAKGPSKKFCKACAKVRAKKAAADTNAKMKAERARLKGFENNG